MCLAKPFELSLQVIRDEYFLLHEILGEILALVPIADKPVDHLEHQSAVLVNERLDRLGRRLGIAIHVLPL